MRPAKCLLLTLAPVSPGTQAQRPRPVPKGWEFEGRIDALLSRMTLKEKAGQLHQGSGQALEDRQRPAPEGALLPGGDGAQV